jgi:hypothetical protein
MSLINRSIVDDRETPLKVKSPMAFGIIQRGNVEGDIEEYPMEKQLSLSIIVGTFFKQ